MSLTKITDYDERAIARLAEQFKESASHLGFAKALARQMQDLENAIYDALVLRDIEMATDAQLDIIGGIVGANRDGETDLRFRLRIKATVLINRRSGEIDTLFQIIALLLPNSRADIDELGPAAVDVTIFNETFTDPAAILAQLKRAKAAGVLLTLHYQSTLDPTLLFGFFDSDGRGFGDVHNPATGGRLTGAVI